MSSDVQPCMRGGMDFYLAAYFYHAVNDYEYGDASGHRLLLDAFLAVPADRGQQGMDEICGALLFHCGGLYSFQRHAQAWGVGVDAAPYVKLSLLFQKADNGYAGRIPNFIFCINLHWNVLWRMGSDVVECGLLFGAEGDNEAASL